MMHAPVAVERRADSIVAPGPVREMLGLQEPTHPIPQTARIRIRITHSVPLVRAGIAAVLSGAGDFEVDASYGGTDVLIGDIETGLRALATQSARNVLIIAQDDGEAVIRKALEKGVRGFLLHTCGPDELKSAVKTVSRGGTAFAPFVASRIAQSFASEALTERELEVLQLMVHGYSDKDMARKLVIALGTVKSHMKSILTKLGAARRTEAAAIAQRRGLTRIEQ